MNNNANNGINRQDNANANTNANVNANANLNNNANTNSNANGRAPKNSRRGNQRRGATSNNNQRPKCRGAIENLATIGLKTDKYKTDRHCATRVDEFRQRTRYRVYPKRSQFSNPKTHETCTN